MKKFTLSEYVDRLEKMLDRHDDVFGKTGPGKCPRKPYYRLSSNESGDASDITCKCAKYLSV